MALTPADYQRRWRAKKRKAEIEAGLRPKQKRPKSAAEIKRAYRAKLKHKAEEAKYAASRARRQLSRSAPPIAPEFRVGDCREVLHDIAAESAALVLTDPAYGNASESSYRWLADFAARMLVPRGSLICFTGSTTWYRDATIFAERLQPRPLLFMTHTSERPMRGGETIRIGHRPVPWFTKGPRRRLGDGRFCEVPTLVRGIYDKSLHPWQQGDANAIWPWIESLTDPGDLVIDPFCGSGEWGHLCAAMGRKWIGADIVEGGSTRIAV